MSASRGPDVEVILRDWLQESRPVLPEATLDAASAIVRSTSRRRLLRGRRLPGDWLVAASIAIVAVAGSLAGLQLLDRVGGPVASPPSVIASPAPTPGASVDASALPGIWYAVERPETTGESWVLRLTDFASLQGSAGTFYGLSAYATDGDTMLIPSLPGGACSDLGARYRWSVDGTDLQLEPLEDGCAGRRAALTGRWERLQEGWSLADRFRFPFTYRAPGAKLLFENSTGMHLLAENDGVEQQRGFGIWVVEDGFADACAGTGTVRLDPGADGLTAHLRSIEALEVEAPEATSFDGRPATIVRISGREGSCQGASIRIWRDTGRAFGAPREDWFSIPIGGRAEILVIEIGGSTVALAAWAPDGEDPMTVEIRQLLEQLRFLAQARYAGPTAFG